MKIYINKREKTVKKLSKKLATFFIYDTIELKKYKWIYVNIEKI